MNKITLDDLTLKEGDNSRFIVLDGGRITHPSEFDGVIITGPPAAGKGTKTPIFQDIFKEYGTDLTHLSTGDVLRELVSDARKKIPKLYKYIEGVIDFDNRDFQYFYNFLRKTEKFKPAELGTLALALNVKYIMDRGELVDDNIMTAAVAERIGSDDKIESIKPLYDGFPRTKKQIDLMSDMLGKEGRRVDLIIMAYGDNKKSVLRALGRRICPNDGTVYNVAVNGQEPKDGKYCHKCNSEVVQRKDDLKIVDRILTYEQNTAPAISYMINKFKVPVLLSNVLNVKLGQNLAEEIRKMEKPVIKEFYK